MKLPSDEPPAIVHEKRKYANFTIRGIGGPNEVAEWRRRQAAKDALYNFKLNQRDERIAQFEAETNQKLDVPTLTTASWIEKQAEAESERAKLKALLEKVVKYDEYVPEQKPKLTFFGRILNFFSQMWKSANF